MASLKILYVIVLVVDGFANRLNVPAVIEESNVAKEEPITISEYCAK